MPRKRTAGEADLEDGHGKGPMASSVHGSWQGSWEQWLAQSRQQGSRHRKMADLEDGYGTGQLRAMASSVKAAAKPIWKMAVAIGQSMAMASSDDANGEGQGSGEADLEDGYGKGREWPWQSSVGQGSGEADLEDKSSLPPGYYIPGIYVSGEYTPRTPELPGFESPRDPRSRTPEWELEGSVGGKGKDVARMSEVSQHLQQQQEQHQ